jgi:hypothetical protein
VFKVLLLPVVDELRAISAYIWLANWAGGTAE